MLHGFGQHKRRSGRRRRKSRRRKREKERRYAWGFFDAVVACAHGDILLICLNYCCYNYHGTSSWWESVFGSLGLGSNLHEENWETQIKMHSLNTKWCSYSIYWHAYMISKHSHTVVCMNTYNDFLLFNLFKKAYTLQLCINKKPLCTQRQNYQVED